MNDDPEVGVDAGGPEMRVARVVDAVHLQTGMLRIGLQIERRQFCGLLVRHWKARQGVGESVGDKEVHVITKLASYIS